MESSLPWVSLGFVWRGLPNEVVAGGTPKSAAVAGSSTSNGQEEERQARIRRRQEEQLEVLIRRKMNIDGLTDLLRPMLVHTFPLARRCTDAAAPFSVDSLLREIFKGVFYPPKSVTMSYRCWHQLHNSERAGPRCLTEPVPDPKIPLVSSLPAAEAWTSRLLEPWIRPDQLQVVDCIKKREIDPIKISWVWPRLNHYDAAMFFPGTRVRIRKETTLSDLYFPFKAEEIHNFFPPWPFPVCLVIDQVCPYFVKIKYPFENIEMTVNVNYLELAVVHDGVGDALEIGVPVEVPGMDNVVGIVSKVETGKVEVTMAFQKKTFDRQELRPRADLLPASFLRTDMQVKLKAKYLCPGTIMAMDPGWGKTAVVFGLVCRDIEEAASSKKKKPTLVIVPPHLHDQWRDEASMFFVGANKWGRGAWLVGCVAQIWAPATCRDLATTQVKVSQSDLVIFNSAILESPSYKSARGNGRFSLDLIEWGRICFEEAHEFCALPTYSQRQLLELRADARHCITAMTTKIPDASTLACLAFLMGMDPFTLPAEHGNENCSEPTLRCLAAFIEATALAAFAPLSVDREDREVFVQHTENESALYREAKMRGASPRELVQICCSFGAASDRAEVKDLFEKKKNQMKKQEAFMRLAAARLLWLLDKTPEGGQCEIPAHLLQKTHIQEIIADLRTKSVTWLQEYIGHSFRKKNEEGLLLLSFVCVCYCVLSYD